MEEDIKVLNYRGLSHLVERLKTFFIKNPKQKAAGKYLRCIDSDGNVEWASLPSFVNLIDGFNPTTLVIGGIAGRTLTTESEVKGDCYIATEIGTLFPSSASPMVLEVGDSIIFRRDVAAGTVVTADDIIYIESSVTITAGTSALAWDTEITLATVEGVPIKAKLPTNPNTDTQANWNETDISSAAYILNKPSIPSAQVQADWNQTTNTEPDYIKNKPSLNFLPLAGGTLTGQVYQSSTVTGNSAVVTDSTKYNWAETSSGPIDFKITKPVYINGPCEVICAIKNIGASNITVNLPNSASLTNKMWNGSAYDNSTIVHNMTGDSNFTVESGKLAEIVVTYWSATEASFNGGVEE